MKQILIIFKKEMKDMLRDRRTIFFMIVMPFLAIFLTFNLTMRLGMNMEKKAREKTMKVAVVSPIPVQDFTELLKEKEKVEIVSTIQENEISEKIRSGEFDFALLFADDFNEQVSDEGTGGVDIYYLASASENERALSRIHRVLGEYGKQLLSKRLENRSLASGFAEPLRVNEKDISTVRAKVGERIGGMLPYFIILFCFLGAMYPAIDLAAGEKERGTMETLLISPATRGQIVMGKFFVVTLSGIFTAVASFLWLFIVFRQSGAFPKEVISGIMKLIELKSVLLIFSMLIPLCAFFGALLLSFSIFAKSYKEAQSIIGPLNFIIIIPLLIGIFPGIKLNAVTALIPLLNISLATKEIIAGTIQPFFMVEIFLVLLTLAAAGLTFCTFWFKREGVIFRGA